MTATKEAMDRMRQIGLSVQDLRGQLPTHSAKEYRRRALAEIKGVCLHHTAGRSYGADGCQNAARYHVEGRNWPGLGYWAMIGPDGRVYVCHDLEVASYAQGYKPRPGDENREFVGVALQGAFRSPDHPDLDEPTAEQLWASMGLWLALRDCLRLPKGAIFGHYLFGKAACPGGTVQRMIEAVRFREHDDHEHWRQIDYSTWVGRQTALKMLADKYGEPDWLPGPIDGLLGGRTRAAIESFQADNGLPKTGMWGAATMAKVRQLLLAEA